MEKKRLQLHAGAGDETTKYWLDHLDHLQELFPTLAEGTVLQFFDIDGDGYGNRDDLLFQGTVYWDNESKRWYALIDQSSFHHQSDSK